jgi:glyoxylase-like metal-dependent hydrolase (beta-lactamase superfamily II)
MTEILPGVHTIDGIDPSPDFSTHVYLVKDKGGSWTLIDTGLPGALPTLEKYLAKIHVEPTSIKKILITHLHRDHTGSLAAVAKATGARTYAHWLDAAFIEEKPKYDGPGMPPAEPFRVDEVLKDGDAVDAAGGLIAYHTPGHTPGHTAFYQPERKWLFSGDLFFGGDGGIVLTTPDFSIHVPTAQVSARRMAQLAIDSLFIYHGGPVLKGAGATVHRLVDRF